jgi:hypothetical protein
MLSLFLLLCCFANSLRRCSVILLLCCVVFLLFCCLVVWCLVRLCAKYGGCGVRDTGSVPCVW